MEEGYPKPPSIGRQIYEEVLKQYNWWHRQSSVINLRIRIHPEHMIAIVRDVPNYNTISESLNLYYVRMLGLQIIEDSSIIWPIVEEVKSF